MNKTHLVKIPVTNVYEVEVSAPDDHHIFNHQDPTYARHISKQDLDKLRNPEWFHYPVERICKIEEVLEPSRSVPFGGCLGEKFNTEDLEREIFNHV